MGKKLKIMIVAGEASGDAHAAKLVRAVRETEPATEFDFFGAAGPKMRDAGVETIVRSDDLAIVGIAEITAALPAFLRAFRDLKNTANVRRPDIVILVDFPDFNLKLARSLKKQGLAIVYYISPQLWAWRKHRVRIVRKYVDLMLVILPFEKEWYLRHGVEKVEYVGSPLAREVHASREKKVFCRDHGLDPAMPIVALLPGSRGKEIARILPLLLDAAAEIAARCSEVQFLVAAASEKDTTAVRTAIDAAGAKGTILPEILRVIENETYDALASSDAAAVTSGTATLEAGILGTPMAVVYKTSAINFKVLSPMIEVEHYGLINLIAGKRVAEEFIQDEFTAGKVSNELLRLLEPETNAAMRKELEIAAEKLGRGGASKRAAEAVLKLVRGKEDLAV